MQVTLTDRKLGVVQNESSSFTHYLADVRSAVDYYPFGMQMPGRSVDEGYRWGFNTQEKVDEIEDNHFTAEFWEYDSRIARRWNRDPKPIAEESEYAVNRNSPNYYNDPDGDNPILGAVIAAFTEYAGIVGSKMLSNKSFTEANSELSWEDAADIGIAAIFGAASLDGGITNFAAKLKNPNFQKIVAKLLEVGLTSLESSIKASYKEDFDLKSIIAGALTEVGMSNLLKTDVYKEAKDQINKNAKASTKRADDLSKRKKPNEKLVKNAKRESTSQKRTSEALDNLDNAGKIIKGTVSKTLANKAQDATKPKKKKDVR